MVKLTAWTKFLTDYHKKSGNAKLSKSMKEASKLYKKHNGKTGKHGKKRGGADSVASAEVAPATGAPATVAPAAVAPAAVAPAAVAPEVVGGDDEPVAPVALVAPAVSQGGRSRKRKGSKKSKTRRR
jgi:hypothetical protein